MNILMIPLTQGEYALIDDVDFPLVSAHKWRSYQHKNTTHAIRILVVDGKRTTISMHRVLLDAPSGMDVDHWDRNGLNNRRGNLRLCTRSQNMMNQRVKGGTSNFKGVHWNKQCRKWYARIQVNGKQIHIGSFADEIEAAQAYDVASRELSGEFARLNFNDLL